ncbi:DUF2057 domain-containing protein [Kaarinaea lacus]
MNYLLDSRIHIISKLSVVSVFLLGLMACTSVPKHQAYPGEAKPASEVATFIVPKEFQLLYVDDESYRQSFVIEGVEVTMLPGAHTLVMEYMQIWDINSESHERIKTQPFLTKFTAAAGKTYSLGFPEQKSIEDARAFANDPKVEVIDTANNKALQAEVKYNLGEEGFLAKLFGSSKSETKSANSSANVDQQSFATGAEAASAAAAVAVTAVEDKTKNDADKTSATANDSQAMQMLKYWWQQADQKEQQKFLQWLEQ